MPIPGLRWTGWAASLWCILWLAPLCLVGLVTEPLEAQEAAAQEASPQPTLALDSPLERPVVGGATHAYRLDIEIGEFVDIVVEQQGIDLVLALRQADGEAVVEVDSPNGTRGEERLRWVIDGQVARPLSLEVASPDAAADPGGYRLRLESLRPASSQDRIAATADHALRQGRHDVQGDRDGIERAVGHLSVARDGYRRLAEPEQEAAALFNLSVAWRRLGRYEEALAMVDQALSVDEGSDLERARRLNGKALIHRQMGHLELAAAAYLQALELWRRGGSRSGEAMTLHNLAHLEDRLGNPEAALALYGEALDAWEALGNTLRRGMTLGNLGRLHKGRGEFHLALERQRQALDVLRQAQRPELLAVALNNLASTTMSLGDFEASLEFLYEALKIRREQGIEREIAQTLNNLSWTYLMFGEPLRGRPLSDEAVGIARRTEDRPELAKYLDTSGRIHLALGAVEPAVAVYREALDLNRELNAEREVAKCLEGLGRGLVQQGKLDEAANVLATALERSRATQERVAEANALEGLALLGRARGQPRRALQHLEESIRVIEALRLDAGSGRSRASYLGLKRRVYESRIELLVALHTVEPDAGWAAQGWLASEEAKARSLLDDLQAAGSTARVPEAVAAEVVQRDLLDDDTLILSLSLGEGKSFLWVLDAERLDVFDLPGRRQIEALSRRLRETWIQPSSPWRLPAQQLADLLLGPVQQHLYRQTSEGRRILWVGEGSLLTLPLAALPDPSSYDGSPLLVRHEVVTAPSASVLLALRDKAQRRAPAQGTLAILSEPLFRNAAALPASGLEGAALAAMVDPGDRLLATGADASRQLVLSGALAEYRYVHFATHGTLDTRYPEMSALVLSELDAEARPVDGHLRVRDLEQLDLAAELVVLSACQTALGKPIRGEGLLGLVRGFLRSGVPRVAASLWQVDDRATAALMERFYEGMLERDLAPSAALRQAQLALWRGEAGRGWRAPYFWAAFQLQGDWR